MSKDSSVAVSAFIKGFLNRVSTRTYCVEITWFDLLYTLLNTYYHLLISRCNFKKQEIVNKLYFVKKQGRLFQNQQSCIKNQKLQILVLLCVFTWLGQDSLFMLSQLLKQTVLEKKIKIFITNCETKLERVKRRGRMRKIIMVYLKSKLNRWKS